jgi:hypothetical protein
MKALVAITAGLLASCTSQEYRSGRTGVVGPDGRIIWDQPAPVYAGSNGYSEPEEVAEAPVQSAPQPAPYRPIYDPSQWHSGAVFGPDGTSLYNLGPHGGTVFGPNGTTIIMGN